MGEFFRGWRRTVGVGTLALACLFMAGSERSRTTCDFISFFGSNRKALHDLSSTRMGLMYMRTEKDFTGQTKSITFATRAWKMAPGKDYLSGIEMNWRINSCGFRFGKSVRREPHTITNITAWIVPYWSIVIPLTLISVYLLLSKPRVPSPKKTSDPTPAKGT